MGFFDFLKNIFKAVFITVAFAAFTAIGAAPTFFGTLKTFQSLFIFGSTLLLSAFAGSRPNLDLPDTGQSTFDTNEPAKTIYGEAITGGLIADIQEIPNVSFRHYKSYVCRYAVCDKKPGFTYEIVDVEVGGEWLQATAETLKQAPAGDTRVMGENGTGTALSSDFQFLKPYAESDYVGSHILDVVAGYGTATETVRDTIQFDQDVFDDREWTGEGLIWAVITFGTGETAIEQFREKRVSPLTVRFRVKAIPTGKSKPNPADVLRLHLKNEMGLADERIDLPSFTATAAACDTRGYEANGIMRSGQEYAAIQWLLQTCEGALIQDSGKFYLKGLDNPASVKTITESMLVEEPQIQHSIPWRERYNHARAEIIDKDQNWTRQSTAEIDDPGGYSEDGNVKFMLDLGGLNFITSQSHANRILLEELARRRHGRGITLTLDHSDAEGISAYDNVTLDLSRNKIAGVWRVLSVVQAIEGYTQVILTSEEGIQGVTTRITTVPATTGLRVTGVGREGAKLTWTNPRDNLITGWEYRVKTTGAYNAWAGVLTPYGEGGTWDTSNTVIRGLSASATYTFQVRAKKGTSVGSPSAEVSYTTPSAPLAAPVISASQASAGDGIYVRITSPAVDTYYHAQVRWRVSGGSWGTWGPGRRFGSLGHYFAPGLFAGGTTYQFQARLEDRSGSVGSPSASVSVTFRAAVSPPPASGLPHVPTSVRVTTVSEHFSTVIPTIHWNPPASGPAPTSYDVAGTYRSTDTPSWSSVGASVRSWQGPRNRAWLWVRARTAAGAGPAVRVRYY